MPAGAPAAPDITAAPSKGRLEDDRRRRDHERRGRRRDHRRTALRDGESGDIAKEMAPGAVAPVGPAVLDVDLGVGRNGLHDARIRVRRPVHRRRRCCECGRGGAARGEAEGETETQRKKARRRRETSQSPCPHRMLTVCRRMSRRRRPSKYRRGDYASRDAPGGSFLNGAVISAARGPARDGGNRAENAHFGEAAELTPCRSASKWKECAKRSATGSERRTRKVD